MKDKTIVLKYGSATVSNDTGIDYNRVQEYAHKIASVSRTYNVVLVCSGSVAAGRSLWKKSHTSSSDIDVRVLAMLGSAAAFVAWQEALFELEILSGQLLVTHREVDDPKEGPSLRAAIEANMKTGVVTIINENDALSETELAKLSYGGDNDGLAAHIAISLQSDTLLLLTTVDGLISKGKVVKVVGDNDESRSDAVSYVESSVSMLGRGGMLSKVEAATRAAQAGIEAYIASAQDNYEDILGNGSGTHFVAKQLNGRIQAKEQP